MPVGKQADLTPQVIPLYYSSMKTSISVPDDIFAVADELARRQSISRSELYATAVAEYVAKHRQDEVTARLNAVYSELSSELDPALRAAQARSIRGEW